MPLIGHASVASNRNVIPAGTTLSAEVPLLNNNGKFTGQYELHLIVALDVGGTIRGQHFDIYQSVGVDAGYRAGWYGHYSHVWVLRTAPGAGNAFNGQLPNDSSPIRPTLSSGPNKAWPTSGSQAARH